MIERAGGKRLSIGKLLLIVAASVAVPSFAQTSVSPSATASSSFGLSCRCRASSLRSKYRKGEQVRQRRFGVAF